MRATVQGLALSATGKQMARKGKESTGADAWSLARAHAYAVLPQRTADSDVPPRGGSLRLDNEEVADAVRRVLVEAARNKCSRIDLELDGISRTSQVRDNLLAYSFGLGRQIPKAATALAKRLAQSMDRRSPTGLVLFAAEKSGEEQKRVSIILFDQEQAIHFEEPRASENANDDEAPRDVVIRILDNTFGTSAKCRKVARFDGRNSKTQFLGGEIYDSQDTEFWLKRFLCAKFELNAQKGVQMIADGLRIAFDKAKPTEREELFSIVMGATRGQRMPCSLESFIAQYQFPAGLRNIFLSVAPNDITRRATFDLDPEALRSKLNYRVFELEDGVFVSSPFSSVGKSVNIDTDGQQKTLQCRGIVLNEKVSLRKA